MDTADVRELFAELRVADVRDGMDWAGLHAKGSLGPEVAPLAPGMRMTGVARTLRYRPSEKAVPPLTPDEYTEWAAHWYREVSPDRLGPTIEQGDIIVVEAPDAPVGAIGSNNSLDWHAKGAAGIVTSGGVRDTDECVMQGVPIFCRYRAQTMVQGRIEFDAVGIPVNVCGVLIRPGDVVVADGDGVIAVPVEHAQTVAKYARQELDKDKKGRRAIYERLGRPLDDTVR